MSDVYDFTEPAARVRIGRRKRRRRISSRSRYPAARGDSHGYGRRKRRAKRVLFWFLAAAIVALAAAVVVISRRQASPPLTIEPVDADVMGRR